MTKKPVQTAPKPMTAKERAELLKLLEQSRQEQSAILAEMRRLVDLNVEERENHDA